MRGISALSSFWLLTTTTTTTTTTNAQVSVSTSKKQFINQIENGGLYFRGEDTSKKDEYYSHVAYVPTSMRSMKVNGRILDGIAEVTMVQEFESPAFFPDSFVGGKTAVYQVPLDELAAVTAFRAEIPSTGRVIVAEVKEKEEAREEFEQAVSEGKNAYLAEQVRADIFNISVGNLPKGALVRITLVYVTTLETLGSNVVRFVFPTAVAPRYEPANSVEGSIPTGEALINDGVQMELDVSIGAIIDKITSNTHELEVKFGDGNFKQSASVKVTDENPTERDVVILLQTIIEHQPQVYVESSAKYGSTAIMLSLVPNISQDLIAGDSVEERKQEFIFILDRSGSMGGEKIQQTRQAMEYIIDNYLPANSIFNIVGFGSTFAPLFKEGSRPLNDSSAESQALNYINSMDADFGGTEILQPIQSVLDKNPLSQYERLIFLLTDGEVSNTKETIDYVRSKRNNGRVFTLGLGPHASALLVRGLARAGQGTAEFVVDGAEMEAAVQRQMEVARTPALTDVRIDWGMSLEGQQGPYFTPPLLTGQRFLVYYLLPGVDQVPETVQISSKVLGTQAGVKYDVASTEYFILGSGSGSEGIAKNDLEIENNNNTAYTEDLIHKITCRTLIRDLEEGGSVFHEREASEEDIRKEIVRLGVKYQIASSETSFVAVDNEGQTENGAAVDAEAGKYDLNYRTTSASFLHALNRYWLWVLECSCLIFLVVFTWN